MVLRTNTNMRVNGKFNSLIALLRRLDSGNSRGRSHKTFFGINLLTLFCKLDHCMNENIIFMSCEKI